MILKDKAKTALAHLNGKGGLQEIHAFILSKEPDLDPDKLYRNLTTILYVMSSKTKEIGSRTVENRKIYKLKDEKEKASIFTEAED